MCERGSEYLQRALIAEPLIGQAQVDKRRLEHRIQALEKAVTQVAGLDSANRLIERMREKATMIFEATEDLFVAPDGNIVKMDEGVVDRRGAMKDYNLMRRRFCEILTMQPEESPTLGAMDGTCPDATDGDGDTWAEIRESCPTEGCEEDCSVCEEVGMRHLEDDKHSLSRAFAQMNAKWAREVHDLQRLIDRMREEISDLRSRMKYEILSTDSYDIQRLRDELERIAAMQPEVSPTLAAMAGTCPNASHGEGDTWRDGARDDHEKQEEMKNGRLDRKMSGNWHNAINRFHEKNGPPVGEFRSWMYEAKSLADQWDRLTKVLGRSVDELRGVYSIGCHPSVALYSLPQTLPQVLADFPELTVELHHDISRKIAERVIKGELDIALVVNPVRHPDLVIKPVAKDEFGFWTAKTETPTNRPESANPVLICEPELLQAQHLLRKLRQKFTRTIHSPSLEVIASLTNSGAGIGLLPGRVAKQWENLKHLPDLPVFQDEIALLYRAENRRVAAFRELAQRLEKGML